MSDPMREQFEASYLGENAPSHANERSGDGYKYAATHTAWGIWKVAWQAQQEHVHEIEREAAKSMDSYVKQLGENIVLQERIADLERRLAEAEKDAARYRAIRNDLIDDEAGRSIGIFLFDDAHDENPAYITGAWLFENKADAAIDAAIEQGAKK